MLLFTQTLPGAAGNGVYLTPKAGFTQLAKTSAATNALDKLIGAAFLAGSPPLSRSILMLSGRASFELIQNSVVAASTSTAA